MAAGEQVDRAVQVALAQVPVVQRQDGVGMAVAEGVLEGEQYLVQLDAGGVEVGEHDGPGDAGGGALAPQGEHRAADLVGGRVHEEDGLGGPQSGVEFAAEVGVAGGVQQVDLDVLPGQGEERELDGALLLVLDLLVVGDRGALGDAAGPG
ncbi:hypothetical protein FHR36_001977 [Kitasatospora paracochleata]|uniref:Uncharacterized protein n=1 Tax=Kitasatospora paracochleata TaxID=58354 RepID=A0ABT1IUN4_9ACTN|nr:hypothetical protein [Kitasatospora paracochleata]